MKNRISKFHPILMFPLCSITLVISFIVIISCAQDARATYTSARKYYDQQENVMCYYIDASGSSGNVRAAISCVKR